jgi:predicted O-methyltransferase YrrM
MLPSLQKIFDTNKIVINDAGETIPLHSNTSLKQGLFLQEMFDIAKPNQSIEVGFAYGISSLFILEKHKQLKSKTNAHIVIEPDSYWGNAAEYNIEKEGLSEYIQIKRDFSDKVLAGLFLDNTRIQFAYIDTTKQFDVIMQDFYLIDKIMDVGGIVVLDDCGGYWPGVQRVARFVNTLPNYEKVAAHDKIKMSFKKALAQNLISFVMSLIPFKKRVYDGIDFSTNKKLGLDYNCIAFKKIGDDKRSWNWDSAI